MTNDEKEKFQELNKKKIDALLEYNFTKHKELEKEQKNLGTFYPWMMHSYFEKSDAIIFHAQILADWATIINLANTFLKELESTSK